MGVERLRATKTGRSRVPVSPPSRLKKPATARDDAASSASSIDTLISRFRASAMASRQSEHDDQDANDGENNLAISDSEAPSAGDEAFDGDDDDGSDFDISPSLSPLTFSPVRPLSSPPKANNTRVDSLTRQAEHASTARARDTMKRAPGTTFFRRGHTNSSDGKAAEEVSPMPKLTQLPRTKPSLLLKPKPSLLLQPKPVLRTTKATERGGHSAGLRRSSPARTRSPGRPRLPPSPQRPCRALPYKDEDDSDQDELSSLSPPSFATDRGSTPGSSSLDSLVGRDLDHLHELLSTAKRRPDDEQQRPRGQAAGMAMRSWTSDDVTAVLRQSTRFRRDEDKKPGEVTTKAKESSFKLRLDSLPASKRAPATSERRYDRELPSNNSSDDQGGESFVEELNTLGASLRKSIELDKQKKKTQPAKLKAAAIVTRRTQAEDVEITETTTANIRAASDAIDKALLLALQPFERLKKQHEREDVVNAAEAAKTERENPITSAASAELPVASRRIVEQLDLVFGDLTQQRHAELKAVEDIEAAKKKAEEDKEKAESEAKAAAEQAARDQEMQVLRLLPLQGKLLSCSMDIDEALIQLEASERWKHREEQLHTMDEAKSMAEAIATLRADTERKIREIEAKATGADPVTTVSAPPQAEAKPARAEPSESWWEPPQLDLLRERFDTPDASSSLDATQSPDDGNDQMDEEEVLDADRDFCSVIQREVVEKLDLTILKLRHVLSIDEKEAQEATAREKQQGIVKRRQQEEKAAQDATKQRELEAAEAARQRVMGLTSLDQVHEWAEADDQLRAAKDRAIRGLVLRGSGGGVDSRGALWQCEFDHEQEIERFRELERAMRVRGEQDDDAMSEAFSDDNAHHRRSGGYPDRDIHKSTGGEGYDSDGDESYHRLADNGVKAKLSHRHGHPSRAPTHDEGPVRIWHDRRRARMPKPAVRTEDRYDRRRLQMTSVRDPVEAVGTRRSSSSRSTSNGERSSLERSFAATIQAFQSDRRAKAKWFKRPNAAA